MFSPDRDSLSSWLTCHLPDHRRQLRCRVLSVVCSSRLGKYWTAAGPRGSPTASWSKGKKREERGTRTFATRVTRDPDYTHYSVIVSNYRSLRRRLAARGSYYRSVLVSFFFFSLCARLSIFRKSGFMIYTNPRKTWKESRLCRYILSYFIVGISNRVNAKILKLFRTNRYF